MESETQRAQFDSNMVMIRHIGEKCTDAKLAQHIFRQLEREAAKLQTRFNFTQRDNLR